MNSSNGFESGERNFMKVIHSIFAILLSIACILYLFLRPGQNNILFHSFSTKALAAESEHNTFSNALHLCTETTYQEHIAAHDNRYYYTSIQKNAYFQITSVSLRNLKIRLFSDTGKNISFHTQSKKESKILSLPVGTFKNSERIFLQLTNQSSKSCSLQILVSNQKNNRYQPKQSVKKSNHKSVCKKKSLPSTILIPNPRQKQNKTELRTSTPTPKINYHTTPNPIKQNAAQSLENKSQHFKATYHPDLNKNKIKKKLSTKNEKKVTLHPQFIKMYPKSVQNLTITPKTNSSNIIWLSSNPLVATISDGKITARREGITIIYIKQKNHPNNSSSCFVKVIERK